ncbi:hypothetical protein DFH09DRAFT_1107953 [Mycena vulgaris]|nr:hypothetical protein DFH09DRAFT_1107953 [Mycena vulgaris]
MALFRVEARMVQRAMMLKEMRMNKEDETKLKLANLLANAKRLSRSRGAADSNSDRLRIIDQLFKTGDPAFPKRNEVEEVWAVVETLKAQPGAKNHCLPILELLQIEDPEHSEYSFMVTAGMRDCDDDPAFTTVWKDHRIYPAGPRATYVVNASRMIPGEFHFTWPWTTRDGMHHLHPYKGDDSVPHIKSRTQAGPMKYYFIDWGLSVQFPSYETRELVTGTCGRLREHIPEISETVPYDSFKVDVSLVGEVLNEDFLAVSGGYVGLDFLVPFTRTLRRSDPASRPEAEEALALFRDLVSNMGVKELTGTYLYDPKSASISWITSEGQARAQSYASSAIIIALNGVSTLDAQLSDEPAQVGVFAKRRGQCLSLCFGSNYDEVVQERSADPNPCFGNK